MKKGRSDRTAAADWRLLNKKGREKKSPVQLKKITFKEEISMTENIEVLTHSSIRIHGSCGTIYIDPYQVRETPKDADYLFITHDHYDHYSLEDIQKVIGANTVLIVPEKMLKGVKADFGDREILTVCPGESYQVRELAFETVAAYNLLKPFHPKNKGWCGYILTVNGSRIYIAGDTDATKEALAVTCDIAMVPIGGTFTMDAKKAAELINRIGPKVAIPVHYGSVAGKPEDAGIFRRGVKPSVTVETKLVF